MNIAELFGELDVLILHHFGDLQASLRTQQGKFLIGQLLLEENRNLLRDWYNPPTPMNSLATEIKAILESELGERL